MLGFHLCIRLELKFGTDLNSKLNGKENRKKKKRKKLTLYTWAEFGSLGPPLSAAFPFRWLHARATGHRQVGPRGQIRPLPLLS